MPETNWQELVIRLSNASYPTEFGEILKEFEKELETFNIGKLTQAISVRFVTLKGMGNKIHHVNPAWVEDIESIRTGLTRLHLPNRNKLTIQEDHLIVKSKLALD